MYDPTDLLIFPEPAEGWPSQEQLDQEAEEIAENEAGV